MNDPLEYAKALIEVDEYQEACKVLLQALNDGYDALHCLHGIGLCQYSIAAYRMKGTGMLSGMSRRTYLLDARKHLEKALKLDDLNPHPLYLLCAVEYALGLLLTSKDGNTERFYRNYCELEAINRDVKNKLAGQLDEIKELFSF